MNKKTVAILLLSIVVLAAFVPPLLRERIAIYAKDDSWIVNGFDIIWYTGDLSGESARVDGANGRVALVAPTTIGTATPVLDIRNNGVAESLVIRNNGGTPVFYVDKDGAATYSGFSSGGGTINAPAKVVAPTAVGTATPAFVADSLGAGNVLLDVRDSATPVFSVNNGGNWVATGGGTNNNWAMVSAPTAIATATPAMVVDSLGVSILLDVRDAATPVFSVNNGGTVTGKVLRYATSGTQIVCGTETITDTTNVSHGLTTPSYAMCSLNQTLAGDAYGCNATISGATVTVKVRNNAATPAANAVGASVNWCVIGTP